MSSSQGSWVIHAASWGAFLLMGLVCVILASIVNIFLASAAVQRVASMTGVVVFTGLAAYDTPRIKEVGDEADRNAAVQGARTLCLDFIKRRRPAIAGVVYSPRQATAPSGLLQP